ncbi:MAG: insulinase family protein [Campylobacter sp.]|nr:insulinase family protein [Campylobacter sp.]
MQYLEFKKVKIPFIFEENRDFPIIVLKLVFKNCGRSFDEIAGLARMFAKLLNEGVNDKFFKDLEFRAINLGASSGFESLEINLSLLKEHKNYAAKALAALLKNPRFEEKILHRLKLSSLGELASKNSDFDYLAKNLLNATIFKYKEFSSPNDGDEKSIDSISLNSLKNFHKKHIHLNNLIITLGGDLSFDEGKDFVKKILEGLEKGQTLANKNYNLNSKNEDKILVRKESEQAYIYFASPFFAEFKDEDLYLGKIALFILGQGGFGSRIMEEVRVKRGLAYSAYAMLDMSLSYKRVFGYLQTKNENAKEAKKLVKEIFKDFVQKGVSQSELNAAKNFLIGSTPLRYESLSKRLALGFNEYYQGLELGHYKKELEKIKKADLKKLNAYIKNHKELLNLSFASIQNEG